MRIENATQLYSNTAQVSKNLGTAFMEEMVAHIMPKSGESGFAGGIGEEQFSSFLNREYAAALSASLDLGFKVRMDG
ncbi:MAG: hypothetical protein DI616_14115 [Paracoccus denitrificans]|uniref:Flagellar protein FlgJ N-terminal domain-containing protein n=1 Tax=Paracoccus denitrificans TaxID=266 RepID=A0A533I396_PARDE|nr:MAG: hypothetical protein DI616_14115 [Paracoccus denitrificans]